MSDDLRWIAPIPPQPDYQVLAAHQLTREFYAEVWHRQAFEAYCQQYYAVAEKHRRELKKMQADFNLLGWFYRGRGR